MHNRFAEYEGSAWFLVGRKLRILGAKPSRVDNMGGECRALIDTGDPKQGAILSGALTEAGYRSELAVGKADALSDLTARSFDASVPIRLPGFRFIRLHGSEELLGATVTTIRGEHQDSHGLSSYGGGPDQTKSPLASAAPVEGVRITGGARRGCRPRNQYTYPVFRRLCWSD